MITQATFYAEDKENDCFETFAEIRPLSDGVYEFIFTPQGHRETWGEKMEKKLKLDQLPKDFHARINMVRMFPDYTYRSGLGYKFSLNLFTVLITPEEIDFLLSV